MSKRIEGIFGLGWRGVDIDSNDIKWILNQLKGVDLGEETPWLRGYHEHSGKS